MSAPQSRTAAKGSSGRAAANLGRSVVSYRRFVLPVTGDRLTDLERPTCPPFLLLPELDCDLHQ